MIVVHMLRKGLLKGVLGVAAVVLFAGVGGAAPALALSPWWHLTSGSRPAYLHSGLAKDEVEKLTVSATKGDVLLAEPQRIQEAFEGKRTPEEVIQAIVPYNASAQQVQEAIATKIYPSRKVVVTGGPGSETGSDAYTITFPGQSVAPVYASGFYAFLFGGESLSCEGATGSGCTKEVSVSELSKGMPDGQIVVDAANLGDADTTGTTKLVEEALPAGMEAVSIEALAGTGTKLGGLGNDGPVECSLGSLSCAFAGRLAAYDQIEARIGVVVAGNATSGGINRASVFGGGGPSASVARPVRVGNEPVGFGIEEYELTPEEEGGKVDTQAGSHPFQLTTTLTFDQTVEFNQKEKNTELPKPAELVKDLRFKLPAGLIGNPTPFPRCTLGQFLTIPSGAGEDLCSAQTVVGVVRVTVNEPYNLGLQTLTTPMFNLEPSVGEPARFGFLVPGVGVSVYLDTGIRTGSDYGVTVSVSNINQIAGFMKNEVTFWGVPGDSRHDKQRGFRCIYAEHPVIHPDAHCNPQEESRPPPLLSLPTSCTGPLQTSVEADSWLYPGGFLTAQGEPMQAQDGCNRLPFSASISVAPDGQGGSTPTGLTVGIHVPQDEALNGNGLAPSQVRDTTVVLPEGVALNPAAGDGLQACSDTPEPARPEGQIALGSPLGSLCPDASKVGTVEVKSPLLANPLVGGVFLATQNQNPFGSLVALYLVFEDPISGSLVKLAGEVKPDPVTGQLVSTFKDTPQLPFEDLKLHFFGGSRAPLGTPALCGDYTSAASLAPWSGNPPAQASSTFQITSGPNGSPCHDPLPFNPSLTAGSTNIQAGAFTPFTMTMSRADGQQNLQAIQLHMPPGLSGLLSSVKLCAEPQADQGTCGAESEIGQTTVSVGLGGNPFTVTGGKVFVTEGYGGAPYGLSIVNPAKAGPYDLEQGTPCDCLVVRAKIEVNPLTAALTITSDNSGPYKIPTILSGIPLQIQHVNVTINRQGFTFNPTNCSPMQITGSLTSTQGATSALSVPLQVTNCATLTFKPGFKVSTSGRTSRANGASLRVKLTYPKAPFGSQTNIKSVKVDLPKQLPSRLTTLQKACPDSTFNRNPALCSPQSRVGEARAITPLLPVPLTGPAYFVSYGSAKFPELVIVLSGYGTTIQLHAETFISPTGITSSTFRTVPDAPVGSFELTLPQGKYSALAANGDLCKNILKMPTAFTAQNGAVIKQSTPISVTGCAKHKTKHKPKKRNSRTGGGPRK